MHVGPRDIGDDLFGVITTRGAKEDLMIQIAAWIEEVLNDPENEQVIAKVRGEVNEKMKSYPLFAY